MKKLHSILVAASLVLAATLTLSCSGGGDGGDPSSSSGNSLLLNFTSDMIADGQLRWMPTDSTALVLDSLPFDQDSRVFTHDGKIFILERPLDPNTWVSDGKLSCLDVTAGRPDSINTTVLAAGSNPQEIAFIGNKGYIALYGLNYLQAFTYNGAGCTLAEQIPLPNVINSPIFGAGSTQNAASIKAHGNTLFVVIQRWNPYPTGIVAGNAEKGVLVRINVNNPSPNNPDTVQLKYYNPQSSVLDGQKLYIASAYNLSSPPGIDPTKSGIEYLNGLTASTTTNLIDGSSLGGDRGPTSMVLGNGVLWTIAYRDWPSGGDLDAKVMSVSLSGTPPTVTTVLGVDKATCLVYDNVLENLFIGNGNAFSSPPASLLKYGGGTIDTIGNSVWRDTPQDSALPPYSLAIVRY